MAMHAIAITPLIHCIEDRVNEKVWFADDATDGGISLVSRLKRMLVFVTLAVSVKTGVSSFTHSLSG